MFARFFIDRPIFASVLSILITVAGAISVFTLPIAQYPAVAPPTVQIDCNYPGASAQVVASTVASPIEQQVNGVERMLYMSSQSTSDGSYTLTVTFEPGMDLDVAQVLVQNRVSLAMPLLPDVVRATGITMRKRSPDILMTVSLSSPDNRYDQLYLSNYAVLHCKDELARLQGISEVLVFGQRDYSMRIWLDPDKLAVRNLSVADVINAIREQNLQVAAGQIGQPPGESGQVLQVPMTTLGRLANVEQFEDIIVLATHAGQVIRIKDVGRVALGARSEDVSNRFDGKPTVGLAVFILSDANSLDTADEVKSMMHELSKDFPEGMIYEMGYDTTPFIRESVNEVFKALGDAILLVSLVVLVFLQGWRAAIIPLIAVPVAIIGTFAAMAIVGFSINNLTLFGLVLAIGIVVDDAIVVVEAVEHHIENGLRPREAAIAAMQQVAGPVIAVGLVLSAVFIPCAFITGVVGEFFRQFALTIAVSTILSMFNSLTLSPALAALLLKPLDQKPDLLTRLIDFLFGWFFRLFNYVFKRSTDFYVGTVSRMLRMSVGVLVVYGGLLYLTYWGFLQLPTGFIPSQDKGYFIASVQLPDATAAERTSEIMGRIERIGMETPGVKNVNSVAGNSFMLSAYGSNFGSMFIILKDFADRKSPEMKGDAILATLRKRYANEVPEALVNVFPPPAVSGLGRSGGFKIMVEDRGDNGLDVLQGQTDNLIEQANLQPELSGLFTVFNANSPQLFVDIDRTECMTQGINLGDVFSTLQGFLGSRYVNDFNRFGRTWQVVVQADSQYRDQIEDVRKLRVRNARGGMVPLGSLATVRQVSGPLVLTRYNMYPAAAIQGNVAAGISTGQGIDVMEKLAKLELPPSMAAEWTEITFIEQMSQNTGMMVFGLSVVFVFLVLAALYESWSLPLAVILVVPMCVLSSIAGVAYADMDINVFTQIGFVVLIGLASKNAILIVEFAKMKHDSGASRREATLEACKLRLRPIMMTSFAFILGVVPLLFAEGAGAEMRRTLGTAVFSGMLGVTLFGIFLTPVFFFVIETVAEGRTHSTSFAARGAALALDIISLGFARRAVRRGIASLAYAMRRPFRSRKSPIVHPPTALDDRLSPMPRLTDSGHHLDLSKRGGPGPSHSKRHS